MVDLFKEVSRKMGDLAQLNTLIPQLENRFSELKAMLSQ